MVGVGLRDSYLALRFEASGAYYTGVGTSWASFQAQKFPKKFRTRDVYANRVSRWVPTFPSRGSLGSLSKWGFLPHSVCPYQRCVWPPGKKKNVSVILCHLVTLKTVRASSPSPPSLIIASPQALRASKRVSLSKMNLMDPSQRCGCVFTSERLWRHWVLDHSSRELSGRGGAP